MAVVREKKSGSLAVGSVSGHINIVWVSTRLQACCMGRMAGWWDGERSLE